MGQSKGHGDGGIGENENMRDDKWNGLKRWPVRSKWVGEDPGWPVCVSESPVSEDQGGPYG